MGNLNHWNAMNVITKHEDFINEVNVVDNLIQKNTDDLSFNELNRLIYSLELLAISYRKYLQTKTILTYDKTALFQKIKTKELIKIDESLFDLPVFVANFATEYGDALYCKVPFTFKKAMRYSFHLAKYINAALDKLAKNDNNFLLDFSKKYIVYVIRCDEKYNHSKHCDNDNMELSEIINVIFSHIGSSDNPLKMSIFSDFVPSNVSEDWGVHLCVMPYQMHMMNGVELLEFLSKKNTK